jgi:hypothetical protein
LRVTVGGGAAFSATRGADFAAEGGLCFSDAFPVLESGDGRLVTTGAPVVEDDGEVSPLEEPAPVAFVVLVPEAGGSVVGCEDSVSDGELPPDVATLYTTTPIALRKRTNARIRRCR